jgi:hypothetical protein
VAILPLFDNLFKKAKKIAKPTSKMILPLKKLAHHHSKLTQPLNSTDR